MERKEILRESVIDSERIAVSKVMAGMGTDLYGFALQNELRALCQKRDSKYWLGKRPETGSKSNA